MWIIFIIGFVLAFLAGVITGGALVTAADDDTVPWNKEWDE